MKLKVCGIRTPEALFSCAESNIDFIGFNFVETSKRKVSETFYPNIAKLKNKSKVGIFQNKNLDEIYKINEVCQLDVIQLHGEETPDFIQKIKLKMPETLVWKAFSVNENFTTNQLQLYSKNCDLFLFDGSIPGSGSQILDTKLLEEACTESINLKTLFGLAGGINAENIGKFAQDFPEAHLLDTASGVETEGVFDEKKFVTLLENLKT